MNRIDSRGVLDKEPFSFQVLKDFRIRIFWNGKEVMVLNESAGKQFLRKIDSQSEKNVQLIMAKMTGNFKRGNERNGK